MIAYWSSLSFTIIGNVCAVFVMWQLQEWLKRTRRIPSRHSLILGTSGQKFLHMEDFWTMGWGDLYGLPFVFAGFIWLVVNDKIGLPPFMVSVVVATIATCLFYFSCTGTHHKPDWGYPEAGKVSWGGIAHSVYFWLNLKAAIVVFWSTLNMQLNGPPLWLAWLGGLFYIGTFVADIKAGNFAKRRFVKERNESNASLGELAPKQPMDNRNKKGGAAAH